jgi:hypothetical protein
MRAEPWPDETMHARFHSGVIIPPQPLSAAVGATFDDVISNNRRPAILTSFVSILPHFGVLMGPTFDEIS